MLGGFWIYGGSGSPGLPHVPDQELVQSNRASVRTRLQEAALQVRRFTGNGTLLNCWKN